MLSRSIAQTARSVAAARTAAVSRTSLPSRPFVAARGAIPALWARGMAKGNKPSNAARYSKAPGGQVPRTGASQSPSKPSPANPVPEQDLARSEKSARPDTVSSSQQPRSAPSSQAGESKQPEIPAEEEKEIPFHSLPDLTQGIPSTLEYEARERERERERERSALTEVDEHTAAAGGRGKGELPASAYISSSERRRNKLANYMYGSILLLGVSGVAYLGRDWDEEDAAKNPDVPNGWALGRWWTRAMTRSKEVTSYYSEPSFEKLLPDPDPAFERPYTLCISLEDLLVHSEWSMDHGWRVAKRPGVDYFLRYLSQYYEIVLFTSVPFAIAEPIIRKLDPFHFIQWPLFREATKYKDGHVVKDLSYLNRDLSKVIIVDTKQEHVSAQPGNAIVLPKWTGAAKDNELVALIPFLEYIHTMQVPDTRAILKSFEGKHIPTEFARREAITRAEFNKQVEARGGGRARRGAQHGSGVGMLGSLLGLKPSNMNMMQAPPGEQDPGEAFAQGKLLQDIARERGQRNYEMIEEEIRRNGEKWLKEEQAMQEEAQKEAMKSMKSSFTGWFRGAGAEEPSAPGSGEKKA